MSNDMVKRPKFSVAIQMPKIQKLLNDTLQDPARRQRFIASLSSAVSVNPALQECDSFSIINCALLGESLELSPSPQLGHFYMVPFENKLRNEKGKIIYLLDESGENLKDKNGKWVPATVKVATFILGYKGYIQLAIRSGQYRHLDVVPVKKGELVSFDPFTEEIVANPIKDPLVRELTETEGYYAWFELMNGFHKAIYWSMPKMEQHADKYSKAFSLAERLKIKNGEVPESDMWKYSSYWYSDFDGMAMKTMLRQLISKWGIMSIEMCQAFESDEEAVSLDGEGYAGFPQDPIPQITPKSGAATEADADNVPQKQVSMDDI